MFSLRIAARKSSGLFAQSHASRSSNAVVAGQRVASYHSSQNHEVDTVVIGNGIIGSSIALKLNQLNPDMKIKLVGPESRFGAATAAAGAMNGSVAEATAKMLESDHGRKNLELSLEATKLWPEWIEYLNTFLPESEPLERKDGIFCILNSLGGILDTENWYAIQESCKLYDVPFENMDPRDVPGINPLESHRPLAAMYLPSEGYMNTGPQLRAFDAAFSQLPTIETINGMVKSISVKDDGTKVVTLLDGTQVSGKRLVMAAGARSTDLLNTIPGLHGLLPAMLNGVGQAVRIEQVPGSKRIEHCIRTPNRAGGCGLHALPSGDNSVYVGATNVVGMEYETRTDLRMATFLMTYGMTQLHTGFNNSRILQWYTGNRPVVVDGHPLFGELSSIPGIWVAAGTYRDGWHQSPAIGKHMAHAIVEDSQKIDLPETMSIFTPERKPIRNGTKEEAVEEGVKHLIANLHEDDIGIPVGGLEDGLKQMFRDKIERIHLEIESDFPLSPDIYFAFNYPRNRDKLVAHLRDALRDDDDDVEQPSSGTALG